MDLIHANLYQHTFSPHLASKRKCLLDGVTHSLYSFH